MYSTSPSKMFVQNWVGPGRFRLESVDTDLPNKITTLASKSLHTWLPLPALEPGTALALAGVVSKSF